MIDEMSTISRKLLGMRLWVEFNWKSSILLSFHLKNRFCFCHFFLLLNKKNSAHIFKNRADFFPVTSGNKSFIYLFISPLLSLFKYNLIIIFFFTNNKYPLMLQQQKRNTNSNWKQQKYSSLITVTWNTLQINK